MTDWNPISEAPYLGEPFLAALPVYNTHTKGFMRFDYAVLYQDEGRLHFYDDVETGWAASDYTLCLPFKIPADPTTLAEATDP